MQPTKPIPEGFLICHAPKHWANGETSICFGKNIILPYILATQKGLGMGERMAVVIFDTFKGYLWNMSMQTTFVNNGSQFRMCFMSCVNNVASL